MKDYEIIHSYTFNPSAGTITFVGLVSVNIEDIQLIRNITTGQLLYASGIAGYGGTVSGNVLTLDVPLLALMSMSSSSTDNLQIFRAIDVVISGGGGGGSTYTDVSDELPSGTIDDVNGTFTIAHTPITGSFSVYLNGQRLVSGVDYTLVGTTLTMTTIPYSTDTFVVEYSY